MRKSHCDFPFINTGLQAVAHALLHTLAVLTASFIVPMQPVTIDKLSQFLGERFHAMVLFLVRNVLCYNVDIGMRHREGAVSPTPRKLSRDQVV